MRDLCLLMLFLGDTNTLRQISQGYEKCALPLCVCKERKKATGWIYFNGNTFYNIRVAIGSFTIGIVLMGRNDDVN